jgi:putative aminopeptidase FrvX
VNERDFTFLTRLLDSPGPSGFEEVPSRVWREEAATFADEVTHDIRGNSYARLKPAGGAEDAPRVLLVGHIDEIGFQIVGIDKDGFLWFDPIGSWDHEVIVGQRVRIRSRNGDVIGVIGKKAAHLLSPEDRQKPTKLKDMWIDIGAADREAAELRVEVGDPVVIDANLVKLTDDLYASRSMDNRIGAFVALTALRKIAEKRPALDVYAVASTTEETDFGGAYVAAHRLPAMVAIAIDLTHATDHPEGDKKREVPVKLGGGAVLARGTTLNEKVVRGLQDAARRLGINPPVQGTAATSWTDADPIVKAANGTATGLVSVPGRYMHSPNEVVSLSDVEQAAAIIAEFVSNLTPEDDFRPGA